MSDSIELTLDAHTKDLGGFTVGRVLPAMTRRLVGPFIFFDHMGPAEIPPGKGIDVRPHPHIALATVTYLFDGELVHRDSLGTNQVITPGAINWMTAGRGITHSERSSPEVRRTGTRAHGLQFWVALPKAHEETEPAFHHYAADSIPSVDLDGVRARVLGGAAYGVTSPVRTFSPLLYVEAQMPAGSVLEIPMAEERGVYVVEGAITVDGVSASKGRMLVLKQGTTPVVRAEMPSRVAIIGGDAMDGPRYIFWNFISSSRERLEQAKADWREGRFPKVPGDETEFIPLPE
jgi:hypothetical protein